MRPRAWGTVGLLMMGLGVVACGGGDSDGGSASPASSGEVSTAPSEDEEGPASAFDGTWEFALREGQEPTFLLVLDCAGDACTSQEATPIGGVVDGPDYEVSKDGLRSVVPSDASCEDKIPNFVKLDGDVMEFVDPNLAEDDDGNCVQTPATTLTGTSYDGTAEDWVAAR